MLSRKYCTDVAALIRAWKRGFSDTDISRRTGIGVRTLCQIKNDIEMAHRRARLNRRREVPKNSSSVKQHCVIFDPF